MLALVMELTVYVHYFHLIISLTCKMECLVPNVDIKC